MPIPVTEAHDRMSYVDPTLANPGAGGLPGAYVFEGSGTGRLGGSSPQSIFKKAFGPRVGLAYSVDPNTVIRAGYGIYFSTQRVGGFAENDSQGFFSSYTYPTPASVQTPAVVLSQITAYPGNLPPFIDPTVMNRQSNALFLESKVDRPGTIQNWTLDVQRQLPFQTIVDVAYVGAHGDHLQAFLHDPNQGNPADQARGACLASHPHPAGHQCGMRWPNPCCRAVCRDSVSRGAAMVRSLRPCVPSRSMEPSRWIQRPWTIPSAITPTMPFRLR